MQASERVVNPLISVGNLEPIWYPWKSLDRVQSSWGRGGGRKEAREEGRGEGGGSPSNTKLPRLSIEFATKKNFLKNKNLKKNSVL